MPPVWRIRDRSTFVELRRRGRRVRRGPLTLTWLDRPEVPPRVAYAIGRSVGTAVVRNRVRRRLRAVVAAEAHRLPPGSYLVGASPEAATMSYDEMRSTVSTAIAALAPPARRVGVCS